MKAELTEVLDRALSRLAAGETPTDILAAYPRHAAALEPLLETARALEALRPVPMPPAQAWQARRQAFMADVEKMRRQRPAYRPAAGLSGRLLTSWERLMLAFGLSSHPLARLAVMLVLVFGLVCIVSSVGLVAAQHSLPGSPLYPLKLVTEEIGLSLTSDATRKADMYLRLALERAQEMSRLVQAGRTVDPDALERMHARLEQALQLAAQLDDAQLRSWLGGAQRALLSQASALQQAQGGRTDATRASLEQAVTQLEQAARQAEAGQQDPQQFRQQRGLGMPAESTPPSGTPAVPSPSPERPTPAGERRVEPTPTVAATQSAPGTAPSPEPSGGAMPSGPHQENSSPSAEPNTSQPGGEMQSGGPDDGGGAIKRDDSGGASRQSDPGSDSDAGQQGAGGSRDGGGGRRGR